ncbi:MAG: ABC transporter permease [Gammaproteobacteria bacterium]
MIRKIGLVAKREFLTTISSKGFLIGLLIMPALALIFISVAPRILGASGPQVRGEVAVIDKSASVTAELRVATEPAAIVARAAANASRGGGAASPPNPPVLDIVERPADASLEQEKLWLTSGTKEQPHLALIVIHPDAVQRGASKPEYGTYDLYVANGVNDRTESVIYDSVRQALVTTRLKATGLDLAAVESTMRVSRPNAVIVVAAGEQRARKGISRALPFISGLLLFLGVITGGQTLMTSTVEEKSSRVVEVLLAAVSPLELMWGKLIGQLGVGMVVMSVYVGLGVLGLSQFSMLSVLSPQLVAFLFVFYFITYMVFGALMLAVGAAVNQMADAQSLMGPIMLLLITPYVLAPIIGQAPDSTFSVAVSFIPPINTFAMIARLASDTPPPIWQPLLTIVVGLAAAATCVWFAAKIFRIGLLMHGKPPNLATMVRWARMS